MVSTRHSRCLPYCVSPASFAFSALPFTNGMTLEALFCPHCQMHRVLDSHHFRVSHASWQLVNVAARPWH